MDAGIAGTAGTAALEREAGAVGIAGTTEHDWSPSLLETWAASLTSAASSWLPAYLAKKIMILDVDVELKNGSRRHDWRDSGAGEDEGMDMVVLLIEYAIILGGKSKPRQPNDDPRPPVDTRRVPGRRC